MPRESPSQTAGPYVHIGCTPNFAGIGGVYPTDLGAVMVTEATRGERIVIRGRVFDGFGAPLRDALVEIWQADADGLYSGPEEPRGVADPAFSGFGRSAGDMETGEFLFRTIRPGIVPFPDGRPQARHVSLWIVARGINLGLNTRMYFPDDPLLASDPVLTRLEHQSRVPTLIAAATAAGEYSFDIHLQGPRETVFFDI